MSASRLDHPGEHGLVSAFRAGDQRAFTALTERYRRQLHIHCYRMLGSFDPAEDMVQETFLRAWRGRTGFEGRSQIQTWLYRIATNVCLNALERAPRRVLPQDVSRPVTASTEASHARSEPGWTPDIPWLQPYPEHWLEPVASSDDEPEARAISRETIELAFLIALQHLTPRQRAVLILRDVLDFSARDTAALLDTSVPAANSALQRARSTMRGRYGQGTQSEPLPARGEAEQAVVDAFIEAWEQADVDRLIALLREDARWAMPPAPLWFEGRAAIERLYKLHPINWQGRDFRAMLTAANRQPAVAMYLRQSGESAYQFAALHVLRIEAREIVEITTFGPELCHGFSLPPTL